jgi:SAM-dependent methyltransferase
MLREDLIRSLFDKASHGLEIGPSYNPIAARRLGYQVDVLDHASADDLRAKYATEANIDASLIEDVDFVWTNRSLSETVGTTHIYDYIVASHVIEHTPDLLGFLSECSLLLKPTGRLVLAVPDMRRCFDACRPLTSLGNILQANHEKRSRHTAATAFDHVAYMTALDGRRGWSRADTGTMALVNDLTFAQAVYERSLEDSVYHDFHAWVFTPSSFRLLTADLYALGKTNLREADFRLTDGFEFISVLTKHAVNQVPPRTDLSRNIRLELMEWPEARERSND